MEFRPSGAPKAILVDLTCHAKIPQDPAGWLALYRLSAQRFTAPSLHWTWPEDMQRLSTAADSSNPSFTIDPCNPPVRVFQHRYAVTLDDERLATAKLILSQVFRHIFANRIQVLNERLFFRCPQGTPSQGVDPAFSRTKR